MERNIYKIGEELFITSDEKIKEGDWMIRDNEQPIKVTKDFFWDFGVRYYKIILTTDQDLIEDGVQSINDEFLEWFVKNPSCEEVETEFFAKFHNNLYKIIIPKEEQKQHIIEMMQNDEELGLYGANIIDTWLEKNGNPEIMKQVEREAEQLMFEEAAKKYDGKNAASGLKSFIKGAKWQQEQDKNKYSEEDLIDAFNEGQALNVRGKLIQGKEWFEQFKNK